MLQSPGGRKAAPVRISKELGRIIKTVSPLDAEATLAADLAAIESRRAQEVESYLRTCVLRLGNACL